EARSTARVLAGSGGRKLWREYAVDSRGGLVGAGWNRTERTHPVTALSQVTGRVLAGQDGFDLGCPRQDSNLRTRLRRAVLYPLSYGGLNRRRTGYQVGPAGRRAGLSPGSRVANVPEGRVDRGPADARTVGRETRWEPRLGRGEASSARERG